MRSDERGGERVEEIEQGLILRGRADGDAEATRTVELVAAVPDDDAVFGEGLVEGLCGLGGGNLDEEEVSVRGKDLGDVRFFEQALPQDRFLGVELYDISAHRLDALGVEGGGGEGGGHLVDVVGRLEVIEESDDSFRGNRGADPRPREAKGLGQSLEDNEARKVVDEFGQRRVLAEVDVGLVDNDNRARKEPVERDDAVSRHDPRRRVPGARHKHETSRPPGDANGSRHVDVEGLVQRRAQDADVVGRGADFVHAVGGGHDEHRRLARLAKDAKQKVDSLVASDADEYLFWSNAPERGDPRLHLPRPGVGVPVDPLEPRGRGGGPESVLVRVQQDTLLVVVTRAPVWREPPDIRPHQPPDLVLLILGPTPGPHHPRCGAGGARGRGDKTQAFIVAAHPEVRTYSQLLQGVLVSKEHAA